MVNAVFDTNILIDYLNGIELARREFALYTVRAISVITWMEVMVGTTPADAQSVRGWLHSFELVPLDQGIAGHAVRLRQTTRIKLPDAVIWATAQTRSAQLVTRNTKDFSANTPGIRIPYSI